MSYFITMLILLPIGWVIAWFLANSHIDIYKDIYKEIGDLRRCSRLHFDYRYEDISHLREEIQELRKRVIELERDRKHHE